MSRKHRRQRQSFPWPIVAFGAILLIVAAFLLLNRGAGSTGGTPSIVVDQSKIDYGYVKFGEDRTFKIKVTNTGDGLLQFKEKPIIQVMEGC